MSWQDEKVTRSGRRDVPQAHPLTCKLPFIPTLDGIICGRLNAEDRDRESSRSAVMHKARFGLRRATHVDRDYDRPFQALRGMDGDERHRLLLGVGAALHLPD